MNLNKYHYQVSKKTQRLLAFFTILGLVIFIAGLFVAPKRIWPNFLIAEMYVLSLSLGAALYMAIHYVTNSGWDAAIKRIPEIISTFLPIAAIGGLVLIFGIHTLYEWSHESVVAHDEILLQKASWLNETFFIIRLAVYFTIWIVLSHRIVRNSLLQDQQASLEFTQRNVRNSVLFLVFGGISLILASIDLLMSLQPHWYSTVFPLIVLSGLLVSGIAVITIFVIILRRAGFDHVFTKEHLATLGSLMMSFSVFWVYMWVSQHLLIWYSNLPEETSYYIFRHFGGWGSLSILNVVLNWFIPFIVLLPKQTKRNDKILLQMAIVLLIGHWLDLYIMVMPVFLGAQPTLSLWEIGPMMGFVALFFLVVLHKLSKVPVIPRNDPYLVESLPELLEEH